MIVKEGFLLAFGELFLKSAGVQKLLRERLNNNISFFLKKEGIDFRLHSFRERIFIETKDTQKTTKVLKKTFGLVWFSESFFLEKASLVQLVDFIKNNYQAWIKKSESFALRVKVPSDREKIIKEVAENIERPVSLTKPKKEIFIEKRKAGWFVYFKKQQSAGGLPAASQGKVLTLVSGGIDSPVAAYLLARRGAENVWIHFHSFPLVSKTSIEKIKELAEVFLNHQPKLKIYFVPFAKIQTKIKTHTPAKQRVLLYRRFMFKIAQQIAEKEGIQALVTGESLGQVSSQVLPNLKIIEEAIKIPVLRPLIAMDKEEIISLAKQINSYEISIKPQEDCCTLFVPKHQTANGNLGVIKNLEKGLSPDKLIEQTFKEIEIKVVK